MITMSNATWVDNVQFLQKLMFSRVSGIMIITLVVNVIIYRHKLQVLRIILNV